MIAFVRGYVASRNAQSAWIDVAGVGYEVLMSQSALSKLPDATEEVRILTYLHVSETAIQLFGFLSEEEKALFERLISVNGVGPKMALSALSTFSPANLMRAIVSEDVSSVTKIPGVGKKIAQRIILELKGTLAEGLDLLSVSPDGVGGLSHQDDSALSSALEALLSMGFSSAEAELALKDAPRDADEGALIRYALKRLGGGK